MGVLSEERRCTNNNVHTIDTGLDGNLGIFHIASNVSQDLGLETELADGLAVLAGGLRCSWRGQLDVVRSEFIESLCDFNLLGGVKIGVGKPATCQSSVMAI